jgi:hypothetical protein
MQSRNSVIRLVHCPFRVPAPTKGNGTRYSASNVPIRSTAAPITDGFGGAISGRGPPGRRSRLELQALSNSLQLASI